MTATSYATQIAANVPIRDMQTNLRTGTDHAPSTIGAETFLDSNEDWSGKVSRIALLPDYSKYLYEALRPPATANKPVDADMSFSREISAWTIDRIDFGGAHSPELREALHDLDDAVTEAKEEDYPIPTDLARSNARRLLTTLYAIFPHRFEVYPTQDGEIAIDVTGGFGRSVLLLCESDGGALCLVNMNGRHRRARYPDTVLLPDGFIREALQELARKSDIAK